MASSALGDYVHLYAQNYLDYGVNRVGDSKAGFRITEARRLVQSRINNLSSVSDETINELKRRMSLNSLSQEQADSQKVDGLTQERINLVYEILSKNIKSGVMKGYLEKGMTQNGFLSYTGQQNILKGSAKTTIDKRKGAVKEWHNKISLIENLGTIDEATGKELLDIYNRATGNKVNGDIKSLIGQLQDDIDLMQFTTCYRELAGKVGENLVAMCADNINTLTREAIEKELKQTVVGGSTSEISIDSNILSQMNTKDIKTFAHYEAGNKYVLNSPTQDKVDVDIIVNKENVLASVKNYASNSKYGIGLMSTSLLYPLLFLERADKFGTHWINLHACPWNLGGASAADAVLKQEIAYEALATGNPFKKGGKSANTFVFIDRLKGKIHVKNIKDMLTFTGLNQTFSFYPEISHIDIINKHESSVGARINKIMAQIHSIKIRTSLNQSFFQ